MTNPKGTDIGKSLGQSSAAAPPGTRNRVGDLEEAGEKGDEVQEFQLSLTQQLATSTNKEIKESLVRNGNAVLEQQQTTQLPTMNKEERLQGSPAESNEDLKLELSWAWEPMGNESSS
ncbi:hypothetical protein PIB30_050286 [Stylosanthes scabra]|uniref:Uncharacterized protein n=1 Tax=Stylosanthes scabra TaxID=79078 RepID=A0ABU6WFM8_9FABA|nr:hypothetical protein [Stylosanthes scabra]